MGLQDPVSSQRQTVSGTVQQLLAPDELDGYALGTEGQALAEGQYVAVLNSRPDPDTISERIRRIWSDWRSWLDDPGTPPQGYYDLIVPTAEVCFAEGDRVTVKIVDTGFEGWWRVIHTV